MQVTINTTPPQPPIVESVSITLNHAEVTQLRTLFSHVAWGNSGPHCGLAGLYELYLKLSNSGLPTPPTFEGTLRVR